MSTKLSILLVDNEIKKSEKIHIYRDMYFDSIFINIVDLIGKQDTFEISEELFKKLKEEIK